MVKSIEAELRDGQIRLTEPPPSGEIQRIIVTFVLSNGAADTNVDLQARGISPSDAGDLRSRLSTFVEDWGRPDMDAYDAL